MFCLRFVYVESMFTKVRSIMEEEGEIYYDICMFWFEVCRVFDMFDFFQIIEKEIIWYVMICMFWMWFEENMLRIWYIWFYYYE